MGVCYSGGYSQVTIQTDKTKFPKNTATKTEAQEINFSNTNTVYKLDPEFEDMPEWEGERYKGYGIKRMKGYKCDLKIDELNKKREKFWSMKKSSNPLWRIIHQACVYDYMKAEEYLIKNNITTLNGCINVCKDKDNNLYYIPNFCINDPFFELEILPPDQNKDQFITITLLDSVSGKNYRVEVKENTKGEELRQMYANKFKIDLNKFKIRFLFGGGIIRDGEYLYQHKIKNGQCVQVCTTEL